MMTEPERRATEELYRLLRVSMRSPFSALSGSAFRPEVMAYPDELLDLVKQAGFVLA